MVDVVFTGGRVVDVRTCTSRIANVAVEHGKIVDISAHELPAKRVVDAAGLVVAPGFIDVHGHLDGHAYAGQLSAMQGITTTVGGNCGLSPLDLEGWFAGQARTGYVINQAELVGHSFSMRRAVGIEDVNARASAAQMDAMIRIADRALRAGAAGVSLGLDYAPGSGLAEIDAMAAIAAEYGRCLPVHTRLFTQNDLYSLYEMLAAAKRSGGRLLLSHFVYQYSGFGTLRPALDVVDAARAKGMDVCPIDETGLPGIVSPENKPCVLVVDDHKDIVWLIKESLSEAYTIVEAYGVEEPPPLTSRPSRTTPCASAIWSPPRASIRARA